MRADLKVFSACGLSMWPLLQRGDLLLVEMQVLGELGDLICFESSESIFCHRLIGQKSTKGDCWLVDDSVLFREQRPVGVVRKICFKSGIWIDLSHSNWKRINRTMSRISAKQVGSSKVSANFIRVVLVLANFIVRTLMKGGVFAKSASLARQESL